MLNIEEKQNFLKIFKISTIYAFPCCVLLCAKETLF